jgi:hypothetical protein
MFIVLDNFMDSECSKKASLREEHSTVLSVYSQNLFHRVSSSRDISLNVCQTSVGFSLANFELEMFYEHGSKSQPLRSYPINIFLLFFCPCVPHHPFTTSATYLRPANCASRF